MFSLAAKDVSKIEARAFGVILEVPVPFPLEKPLLCDDPDSGVKCPVQQGQQAVYKVTLPIEKNVPPVIKHLKLRYSSF